jgi:hypothetical protein
MAPNNLTIPQRLLKYSRFNSITGCLEWKGAKNGKGYGKIYVGKKNMLAHRVSFSEFVSPIPEGALVLHKCDNPNCINPHHLELGDHSKNIKDYFKRSVEPKARVVGERNGNSKLTEDDINAIRDMGGWRSFSSIAKELGVSVSTISRAFHGETWRHV